jgi:ABC-type uncharacterized transport system auxiliary subunit
MAAPLDPVQKSPSAQVIRVDNPSGSRTYNTRDVLVITDEGTLSSAAGAQWIDTVPQMIQDAALSALGQSPEYISVIPVAGARADVRMHIDIRDFSAVYDQGNDAPPIARTRVTVTLAKASTRKFLGSYDAYGEARANDNRVTSIVDAQTRATQDAMQKMVAWMSGLNLPS